MLRARALKLDALAVLLAASFLARALLCLRGGQYFFPDEWYFTRCAALLDSLRAGDLRWALDFILQQPAHTGFIVAGLPAVGLEILLHGDPRGRPLVAALVLGSASTAVIGLVHALARRLGADAREAFHAAFLCACSACLCVYARHVLPYDCALALALWSLWIGLGAARPRAWLAAGGLAGAAFLTYNGYWMAAAAAMLLPLASPRRPPTRQRLFWTGLGFLCPLLALQGIALSRGKDYLAALRNFSYAQLTQADMSEGWSLPFAYLWHAEHGLLLLWCAAVAVLALAAYRRRLPERGRLWGLAVLGLYLAAVFLSVGLGRFGVYGRLVRQAVPFLCLATAAAGNLPDSRWRRWIRLTAACALLQAAFNLRVPWRQAFPREVEQEVRKKYGEVSLDNTIEGPGPALAKPGPYVLLNTRFLHPVSGAKPAPAGAVLLSWDHPVQYLPYQYEGYLLRERMVLRRTDISMRLIARKAREGPPSAN